MSPLFKIVKIGCLNLVTCMALTTMALAVDREVYDKPIIQQQGKTLHGTVVNVGEREANLQRWDVSVQNGDTREVMVLHLDENTTRKDSQMYPIIGVNVTVKYHEQSRRAISFLTDTPITH